MEHLNNKIIKSRTHVYRNIIKIKDMYLYSKDDRLKFICYEDDIQDGNFIILEDDKKEKKQ